LCADDLHLLYHDLINLLFPFHELGDGWDNVRSLLVKLGHIALVLKRGIMIEITITTPGSLLELTVPLIVLVRVLIIVAIIS
jgi:hypothetical protein